MTNGTRPPCRADLLNANQFQSAVGGTPSSRSRAEALAHDAAQRAYIAALESALYHPWPTCNVGDNCKSCGIGILQADGTCTYEPCAHVSDILPTRRHATDAQLTALGWPPVEVPQ